MPSQEIVQTEENILVFDNIFSRGYGFSPQVLTRIPQLSIEAKGLYSYFSSFAGQGGVAFPSTSTILAEMNISKNRFYKYRSELEAWGFITVDIENTRHGRRTVYHLPVEPKPTDKVHELIWVFKKPAAQSVRIALTVVSAVILVSAIGNMGNGTQAVQNGNSDQTTVEESSTMQETDADNADEPVTTNFMGGELFGTTVEKAWETVEAKGYAVAFKSPTGADLNPGRNSMHSSTMKTWRITSAQLDEPSSTVTLWVTSEDGFIEEYGKKAMKD